VEIEARIRRAELSRLEAERLNLALEAKEIEKRLNTRWWEPVSSGHCHHSRPPVRVDAGLFRTHPQKRG